MSNSNKSFGTLPVFFTAISTILGAILFLRFGMAVGTLGFVGVLFLILLGHMVTIPTALAISELATNQKVEGGGEYFIISRSFGLNIGATIGMSLYMSQAISVAFYIIAFTETFEPVFNMLNAGREIPVPRQIISVPVMFLLSILILKKGAGMGVKTLYIIVGILFLSLTLFFIGSTEYFEAGSYKANEWFKNGSKFYDTFAICFPAFTGMTAGVGLSGVLKKPGRSIPLGTVTATFIGMIIYIAVAWKLNVSASPEDLLKHQLIFKNIAVYGGIFIPLGLAASTLSSALGSILVAPRTLQALAADNSLPVSRFNRFLKKEKESNGEPFNATLVTCIISMAFVVAGGVDFVAEIISMFFMVTYGSICLISFLYHFSADPSYRPVFRSHWVLSLIGFLLCVWLMFKINTFFAIIALLLIVILYLITSNTYKERKGMQSIFEGALFQINRNIQVYLQKAKRAAENNSWRPSVVCVSENTFERQKAFYLLQWISHRYGFGTYMHFIKGYFSKENQIKAEALKQKLIEKSEDNKSNIYIDTIISPSFTSAVAQIIQLPGISGMENNMVLFEYDKTNPVNLDYILENLGLVHAATVDVCIFGTTPKEINCKDGIHIWITNRDFENSNLMILLSYIIMGHPDWRKSKISIFNICSKNEENEIKQHMRKLIKEGRLSVSEKNIETIAVEGSITVKDLINEKSKGAALTVIGFREEQVHLIGKDHFTGYNNIGDVLFVNSFRQIEIK